MKFFIIDYWCAGWEDDNSAVVWAENPAIALVRLRETDSTYAGYTAEVYEAELNALGVYVKKSDKAILENVKL